MKRAVTGLSRRVTWPLPVVSSMKTRSPGPILCLDPSEVSTSRSPVANSVPPRIFHVFATPDGETHFEELMVASTAGVLPLTGLRAISYKPNKVDWHHAPAPQFAINLTGELEAEVSDGSRQRFGPGDLVFLEDTIGKGHVTRLLEPVTCIFIHVEGDFDVAAWAAGKPSAP